MGRLGLFRGKGGFDTTPNAFSFTPVTGAPLSTPQTSNTITIGGLSPGVSVAASITGGQYSKDGGAPASGATTAINGTTFAALQTSSALNSTMTSAVLTVGGVSGSYDVTTTAGSGAQLIIPSGTWNGTAGSGGSAPVDPGATKYAIIQCFTPANQRFSSDLRVWFIADAVDAALVGLNSITNVRVSGDCTTANLGTAQTFTHTGGDGVSRTYYAWPCDLDVSAWLAAHASGNAFNIYATAQSANALIADRVIGPFTFYPEATANDADYELRADGTGVGGYTTPKAVLDAARSAGKTCPLIRVTQAATYDLVDTAASQPYPLGNGYCEFRNDSGTPHGVLFSRTSMNLANSATWSWKIGWQRVKFTGIDFDCAFFTSLDGIGTAVPCWANGTKFYNSKGNQTLYYNGSPHPGAGFAGITVSDGLTHYYTENTVDSLFAMSQNSRLYLNGTSNLLLGNDMYTSVVAAYGNVDVDPTSAFYSESFPTFVTTICTIPGATIQQLGNTGSIATIRTVDSVWGTVDHAVGDSSSLNTPAAFAATFAGMTGWTVTPNVSNAWSARWMNAPGYNGNATPPLDATASIAWVTFVPIHGDWDQTDNLRNAILHNNQCYGSSSHMNSIFQTNGGSFGGQNCSFRNNAIDIDAAQVGNIGGATDFHIVMVNNTFGQYMALAGNSGDPTTVLIADCLWWTIVNNGFTGAATIKNCGMENVAGLPTGPNVSGNYLYTTGYRASVPGGRTGNFTPASNAASTTFAPVTPYNVLGATRANPSPAGAI